jgi:hypothetical protein
MSIQTAVFKGDANGPIDIDIDAPVARIAGDSHGYYFDAYQKAAASEGDAQSAAIFAFLSILMGMMEHFDDPQQPYGPLAIIDGRRSPIPADFADTDVAIIRRLAAAATEPFVRARLHDLLWVTVKDVAAGHEAAKSFLALGNAQYKDTRWIYSILSFQRALQILSAFGRDKPPFCEAIAQVEAAAIDSAASPGDFRPLKLIRLLLKNRATDPTRMIPLLESNSAHAESAGDHRRAQKYRDLESEWRRFAGDESGAKVAKLASAGAALKLAEDRAAGPAGSALAASALMSEAIELLVRARADRGAIESARSRLRELQESSLEEMQTYSFETDISDAVRGSKEHVKAPDLITALRRFVLGVPLVKPDEIKAEVLKIAKENPLSHLFSSSLLDSKGRPKAKTSGLLNSKGDEAESALNAEMFSHAEKFKWAFRVSAFIEPARQQIRNDRHPNFEDLSFLVINNPFVPQGHEGIFLRGIHAGFHGDFLIAAHLLVPQIENSIRYVLEANGVDVSVYKPDGTQPVKILGGLLGLEKTRELFGDDLVFELQGALIEKTGFDLRNRIAHGFISEAECFTEGAVLIWWHVLRICMIPILMSTARARHGSSRTPEGEAKKSSDSLS